MASQGHNHNSITTGYDITTEPYGDVTTGNVQSDITTTTVPPEEIGRVFISKYGVFSTCSFKHTFDLHLLIVCGRFSQKDLA